MPWLQALQDDPGALPEIARGVGQARRYRSYHGVLADTVLQAWPADLAPYLSSLLWVEATGFEAALPWPGFASTVKACGQPQKQGASPAWCDALIRAMVDDSDNLMSFAIGRRVAERAGWPAAELAPLRAEAAAVRASLQASLQAGNALTPWLEQPYACESLQHLSAHASTLAQDGELAMVRRLAAARPASAASLARQAATSAAGR